MLDPLTKFVPVAVSVKPAPPAMTVPGEIAVSVGGAAVTVSVRAPDAPPPGVGFTTVIDKLPAPATSDAGIAAVTWVLLTKVVVRFVPLTCTIEPETKLLPVTVNVNPALPAVTLDGEMAARAGTGLLTVKFNVPDVEPSGLTTPIVRVPAEAMSLAGIDAVICVLLTKVVARFEPLTWITEPLTKLLPVAVMVNAGPPAVAALGEMPVSTGTGLVTVNVTAPEGPLPGVFTVIERAPGVAVSIAVNVAVNCVALTNVVLRLAPLTCTTEVPTKFVPVAVRVTGPPPAVTRKPRPRPSGETTARNARSLIAVPT